MLNFSTQTAFHVANQLNDWAISVKDKTELTVNHEDRSIFATHLIWIEQFLDKVHPSKDGYKNLEKFTVLRRLETSFKIMGPFATLRAHQSVLNTLQSHIELLAKHIEKTANLHFYKGNRCTIYQNKIENKIFSKPTCNMDIKKIENKQRHIFHLMLSKTNGLKNSTLKINKLEAAKESYSLTIYEFILESYLKYKNTPVVTQVLHDIKKAKRIAYKNEIYDKLYGNRNEDKTLFFDYCNALYKNYPLLEKSYSLPNSLTDEEVNQFSNFLDIFTLDNTAAIPREVYLRDLKNKIHDKIESLLPGDSFPFCAGTKNHAVMIEIRLTIQEKYVYQIFNTGDGAVLYHTNKLKKHRLTQPVQIKKLNKEAFSDAFLEELILCYHQQEDIKKFYKLHHTHLIEKGNGSVVLDQGKPYPLQFYGTCAYDCVDAWLNSRLKNKEMREVNLIKGRICVNRQLAIYEALKAASHVDKDQIQQSQTLLNLVTFEYSKMQSKNDPNS